MAFIYNLTDTWNDVTTTWNGIKLAVSDTGSSASSKLLNLTISGSSTGSFTVDKSGNLLLSGSVNKITMTAPATGATLTLADGSTFATSGAHSATFTFTGSTSLTFPTSGTVTALGNTTTGSGSIVLATSPTLVTPNLGTPSSATLTNATGLPISTGLTGTGTGVLTALAVNVGSAGAFVTFNGALGTPSSGNLANCTGYPAGGITGLGTGVATALAQNVGSAGAIVVQNGVLGTPSSGTLTNATGLPLTTGVTGTLPVANGGTGITSFGTGVATALGQNVTGSGGIVLATSPTLVTPNLGTPSAATLTNATGLPISTGVSGLGTGVATFLATPSSANLASAVTDETGSGPLVFATSPTFTSQVTFGTQGTTQGSLVLANTASTYATTIKSSNSASAAYTLTLPTTAGTNGYFLQTDGLGNLAWAAGGGGGGGSVAGSDKQVQFNDAGSFGASANFLFDKTTYMLTLGLASTATGMIALGNASSVNLTKIQAGNAAAAVTYTLPTAAPASNGYVLSSTTGGAMSWVSNDSGLAVGTTSISGGTSGRILYDNAGVLGELATTGSGNVVLATSPTLVTPVLGTPTSGTLTNCTGLPVSTGISGLGTDVATALAVNVGTAGAFVVNGGALGTPSSGTLTSCTGLPISTGVSGLGTNVATFLATPTSANLASAVTDETGSGALVFGTSPTITTPTISGNETHTGTGALFLADFSNATIASRFSFQTSTTNGSTGIYALPNGTSTAASWQATNAADPTNASKILIATNASTDVQLVSGINGTGTYLPLSIYTSGGQSAQFSTTKGTFGLGVAGTAAGILNLAGSTSGTVSVRGAAAAGTWTLTLPTSAGTNTYQLQTDGSGNTSWVAPGITAGKSIALTIVFGG